MDQIVAQIQSLARSGDEATRKTIIDTLSNLSYSLETPQDTMQRISYLHLQPALVRVGLDLKLFNILSESKEPLTTEQLVAKTNAAPILLGRILRYLASVGTIRETGINTFTANNITHSLTIPGIQSAIYHNVDSIGPVMWALPDFLQSTNYQDITDPTKTPLQKVFNTDLPGFILMQTMPEKLAHFLQFMEAHHMGLPTWLDVYPIHEKTADLRPDQALFVDAGGAIGHQCVMLRDRVPVQQVPNRVICQDFPSVVAQGIPHDGVEMMGHDFFTKQPVEGARIYYLRMIMHDYPDDKAVVILQNIMAAMSPDSIILVDDMVIPDGGAHWHATQIDVSMMVSLASMERTKEQWYALMEKAGLKINRTYTYTESLADSILECVPVTEDIVRRDLACNLMFFFFFFFFFFWTIGTNHVENPVKH
ncbi:S-adenosyl-L-methionine-dependent methyltransferase [Aspergillus ibericus CBS 121593]|uniref:S-adenosyl-L-methionine-dependent methyltransferase n=1 Tax=Aspergillus ibericus CBS 121593 TaxID=1448316 RepID=A0A395H6G4_9EURO|nr:S-adenosyl-L-methionine-dependent methyltransferase [Aspergillus ibericus CBS 121593]RAL03139.1 S-adenosyl-L-methionine-dependent methyltransferase [Aspergillus ibericus CBS 121593]